MRSQGRRLTWLIAALLIALHAQAAHAHPNGISSTEFGASGCPLCHGGGVPPSVVLSGPTALAPGSTADYTLTIFGRTAQNFGGLNVAASHGTLSTGGPFASGTQTIAGTVGLEITHTAPKQGDFLNVVEFSFRWTAPPADGIATMLGWGNAVNHDNSSGGDAATLSTLDVVVAPIATPTPTPVACGDAAPLDPVLITDPAAQACQAAIAKVGAGYLKNDLKAVRSCLTTFQADAPGGDAIALCVGSATVAPTDPKAAAAITKAQAKARAVLQAKCPDAAVAALDVCADTESALEVCFLEQHRQVVVDAVASQYGVVAPGADKGTQKCQKAIGSAAASYLLAHLRASQKCLVKRNKAGAPAAGAAACVGAVVDNAFVPPLEPKVAGAAAAAAAKLAKKIQGKCGDTQHAALDGCGTNQASALACLLCSHRTAIFGLVSDEFGGL